jgi:hypothetical protein
VVVASWPATSSHHARARDGLWRRIPIARATAADRLKPLYPTSCNTSDAPPVRGASQ